MSRAEQQRLKEIEEKLETLKENEKIDKEDGDEIVSVFLVTVMMTSLFVLFIVVYIRWTAATSSRIM